MTLKILLFRNGALSKLYKETFKNTSNYPTLQEALAEYSDAVTFYDHLSQNDEQDTVSIEVFKTKLIQ